MFYDRFTETVRRFPDLIAVELQHDSSAVAAGAPPVESYTFTPTPQHGRIRRRLASRSRAFTSGSKCAFLAANHPLWVAAYLGVLASGNTAVPLDTAFHADQVRKLLLDSDSVLLFTDRHRLPLAREAAKDLPVRLVLIDGHGPLDGTPTLSDIFAAGPGDFQPAPVTADDIAMILYTSGTTSDPKGVMLSHGNLEAEADGVFQVIDVGPKDAILGILPLFHSLAQMANIMLPLSVRHARRLSRIAQHHRTAARPAGARHHRSSPACRSSSTSSSSASRKRCNRRARSSAQSSAPCWPSPPSPASSASTSAKSSSDASITCSARACATSSPAARASIPPIGRQFEAMGFTMLQGYGMTETCGAASVTPPRATSSWAPSASRCPATK